MSDSPQIPSSGVPDPVRRPVKYPWLKPTLIGLGWLFVTVAVGLVLWVAVGPGALWMLRNFDKVMIGGLDPGELAEALDRVRGRAVAIGTGLLAAIAIIYTAANAASARRTADAAFKAAESSEQTTRASIQSAEAATRTAAATERGLTTGRFTAAVAQLGDANPAIQLGGVHALAGIADDEPTMRQTCIDVLCAYLRLPYDPDPGEDGDPERRKAFRSQREVRHTIIRLIGNHLRLPDEHPHCWCGHAFDFTDVVFDGGNLHDARFTSGATSFRGAKFSGGRVDFMNAVFSGGMVDFMDAVFSGATVDFTGAVFSGSTVNFLEAVFSGATVRIERAEFSGGTVDFAFATFTESTVTFGGAVLSGGMVDFTYAMFSSGRVDFTGAVFSGATVRIERAEFSGGTVDLRGAGGARPAGLPGPEERVPEGLLLPEAWQGAGGGEGPESPSPFT